MEPDKISFSPRPVPPALTFENLSVNMGGVSILDHVTASVPEGGCTAIIGPNGAGKTTLLLAVLGEIPYTGRIGGGYGEKRKDFRIGYVPQKLAFDRAMPITVTEFLAIGVQKTPIWAGVRPKFRKIAEELLDSVRAAHLAGRRLGALSGGELQRVLLAVALQQEPDLLVLDEPAAGVDMQGEIILCELLDELRRKKGFTQLMVSHDLATVTHHAGHVICLNRKVVAEGRPRETLTGKNLTALFGLHMGLVHSESMPDGRTGCSASCCSENADD